MTAQVAITNVVNGSSRMRVRLIALARHVTSMTRYWSYCAIILYTSGALTYVNLLASMHQRHGLSAWQMNFLAKPAFRPNP
jgi:hypothetical protein